MITRKLNQTTGNEPKPPLIRLKELPPEQHTKILEILETHTYKDSQPLVTELTGVECTINALFKFRQWRQTEQELEQNTDLLEEVEAYLVKRKGDWSAERIQKSALGFLMLQSVSRRDVKSFACVTRLSLRREQLAVKKQEFKLSQLKFEEFRRKKLERAFFLLSRLFKAHPEAEKLLQEACALLPKNQ